MRSRALEQIIDEFGGTVYRVALSRTGNAETAQDIYQQTFLLLIEKKPVFTHYEQLKVWLIRVALKLCANERKKWDNAKTEPLSENTDIAVSDEMQFEFCDLLLSLPETLRDVTVLFYIEDMAISDIARTLGISRANVKTRLTRARKILSKIYKEEIL